MPKTLSAEIKVRSYELDAYGHVNHAVFLNYFEQARVEYLEQENMSFGSLLKEGFIFIIVRAEVDYLKPLTMGDQVIIEGQIAEVGKTSITIQQQMVRKSDREPVCNGRFVAVFVGRKSNRPEPVPESFKHAFL